jgi:hypothetical protein
MTGCVQWVDNMYIQLLDAYYEVEISCCKMVSELSVVVTFAIDNDLTQDKLRCKQDKQPDLPASCRHFDFVSINQSNL